MQRKHLGLENPGHLLFYTLQVLTGIKHTKAK